MKTNYSSIANVNVYGKYFRCITKNTTTNESSNRLKFGIYGKVPIHLVINNNALNSVYIKTVVKRLSIFEIKELNWELVITSLFMI
jgi:hypothetical protein